MQYLIHAANVIYLASYFSRDALRLRVLAIIAAICLPPYLYYRPQPLIGAICWNLFFVILNGFWVARLLVKRRRPTDANLQTEVNVSSVAQTEAFSVAAMMDPGLDVNPAVTHLCSHRFSELPG